MGGEIAKAVVGLAVNLPDALGSNVQLLADLGEGELGLIVQANDGGLHIRQRFTTEATVVHGRIRMAGA